MNSALIFQIQSTLILILLYIGLYFRKTKEKHIKIMITSIVWDILLVLQIELTRGAINKASKAVTNPALLNFHVLIAVTTVLLYFYLLYSGNKLKKGDLKNKALHKNLGFTAITLRTMVYITSYLVA